MAAKAEPGLASLRREMARFAEPRTGRSLLQIADSFLPLLLILGCMHALAGQPYIVTLGLAAVAAGFVVRIFIIQHDCGHGSFFRARWANEVMGTLCSLVTLAPYAMWRRQHAGHHRMWNNLDRRQSGVDIYSSCITVAEYRRLGRLARIRFRIVRHPVIYLLMLPPLVFLLLYRVPFDTPAEWRHERWRLLLTNAAILLAGLAVVWALGWRALLLVQLPVSVIASIYGVWLFSLQHRFEHAWWGRQADWTVQRAALAGSSCLRLPRILQWFTGNIGFHHIHHLNARIPNYRLQACYESIAALRDVPTLGLRDGLRAFRFVLWDEEQDRLVRLADA